MAKKLSKKQRKGIAKKRNAQKAKTRRQQRAANPKNSAFFNVAPKGKPPRAESKTDDYIVKAKRSIARTFGLRDKNGNISTSRVSTKMIQVIDNRYGNVNNFYKKNEQFYNAMEQNFNFLYKDLLKQMTDGEITGDTEVSKMMEIMDATADKLTSGGDMRDMSFENLANSLQQFKRDHGIVD